ncbi:carbohydrate porin [Massilia sp. YIM B02763]|uniref:carbohydrate porin n=1 Tax=Massilia sp. YIM B02763 TaxID=3050130 RepID=UPI0025B65EB0|nr:carbohydrate porin [Massilia sp. YIM B02763]MDN4055012.1 carbohydrate porin [Massilia sp. YIM B02763]
MNIIPSKTVIAAAIATAAFGMLATQAASATDLNTSPYLLGDWNGQRTRLAEQGVKFDLGYVSEIASNTTGGTDHKTRNSDQWRFGTTLDLDKLLGWHGGTFYIDITDRNGHNLDTDAGLGNFQQVQEVYGRGQTWRLTNFYLQQSLLNDRLRLKFGRMTIGTDFANFSCDFQNLTFCGAQPGNIVGSYWANWPVSVWAAVAKLNTSATTYLQVGAYQVDPTYLNDEDTRHRGLYPNNPHGTTGALIPVEFGWLPSVNGLPGSYKVGAWYNTSDSADLMLDQNRQPLGSSDAVALRRDGAYGGYVSIQQQVTGSAGGKGMTLFLNASQADKFTAATDSQVAVGMQYKGLFDRPRDMIGVAVGATHGNGRYANHQRFVNGLHPDAATVVNDGYEYATEVYYAWSPIPSLSIRPNVQFIKHPGGTSANSDVVVLGLKSLVTF